MKTINIGFDFGTSQSKVNIYDILLERHYSYVFDDSSEGLSRYTIPTNLWVDQVGKVHFANKNMSDASGFIKLFKILINEFKHTYHTYSETIEITGKHAVAFYCAYVLRNVIDYLDEKYGECELIYQFGIPINYLKSDEYVEREESFRRAYNIAVMIAEDKSCDLHNGVRLTELLERFEEFENELLETETNDWKAQIFPETIAGVAALLSNGELPTDKRYSIVDIGAGTTDISFFEFNHNHGMAGKFYIYCSNTYNFGDQNYKEIQEAIEHLSNEYRKKFEFCRYLCKEKWEEDFGLFKLGGGFYGELGEFISKVELHLHGHGLARHYINPLEQKFPLPDDNYDLLGKNDHWKEYFNFLAISYGLSFPHAMMPEYKPQVKPMKKEELKRAPDEPLTPDVG